MGQEEVRRDSPPLPWMTPTLHKADDYHNNDDDNNDDDDDDQADENELISLQTFAQQ